MARASIIENEDSTSTAFVRLIVTNGNNGGPIAYDKVKITDHYKLLTTDPKIPVITNNDTGNVKQYFELNPLVRIVEPLLDDKGNIIKAVISFDDPEEINSPNIVTSSMPANTASITLLTYDVSYTIKLAYDNNLETLPPMFFFVAEKIMFRLPTIKLPPRDVTANIIKTIDKAIYDLQYAAFIADYAALLNGETTTEQDQDEYYGEVWPSDGVVLPPKYIDEERPWLIDGEIPWPPSPWY